MSEDAVTGAVAGAGAGASAGAGAVAVTAEAAAVRPRLGKLRVAMILVGTGIVAFGAFGLLTDKNVSNRLNIGEWLAGGIVLHDAVLAPVVFVLCRLATRAGGPRTRWVLAAVLMIVGTATLVAAPILLHGRVAIR